MLPSFTGFMVLSIIPIVLTFVISFTSWSGLHKLELFSAAFWRENFIGLVITSYSIHYTKLYDILWVQSIPGLIKYPNIMVTTARNNFV